MRMADPLGFFEAIKNMSEVDGWRLALRKFGTPTTAHYRYSLKAFIARNPRVAREFGKYR